MGFENVEDVRVGKLIEISMKDGNESQIEEMCKKLLANPVVENYHIEAAN